MAQASSILAATTAARYMYYAVVCRGGVTFKIMENYVKSAHFVGDFDDFSHIHVYESPVPPSSPNNLLIWGGGANRSAT